jgi:YihY family inner membrane protein
MVVRLVDGAKRWWERASSWPPLALALTVNGRVGELGGGFLASALTLSLFLSLFPILLVALAVLGFMTANDDTLATDLVSSLGLTGDAADFVLDALAAAEDSRATTTVLGFLGLVWASLGVVGGIQHICGRAWQIPGRGLTGKLVAFGWLLGAIVVLGSTIVIAGFVPGLPSWLEPVQALGGVAVLVAFFLVTFKLLTPRSLPWSDHAPGAVAAGIGVQVLTLVATTFVPSQVERASALYGSIGVVLAVLAWLLLFGRVLVYAVVLNVILHERAHGTVHVEVEAPRFGGEVPITADRSAVVQERAPTE